MNTQLTTAIQPDSTIGILGSGQLGKMMAASAKAMGYRVHIFSSHPDSPAGQVSDVECVGDFLDLDQIESFATNVDVITVETENIPVPTLTAAARHTPTFPGLEALRVSQDRGSEKTFFRDNQLPTCGFKIVRSLEELKQACQGDFPKVLKTTRGGYDGKGQIVIQSQGDAESAWTELNREIAILEEWVPYTCEFSVVGARSAFGEVKTYAPIRNEHQDQILDVSTSPSLLDETVCRRAEEVTRAILEGLDSVGVLTVEFFNVDGEVLVNEIAPRPHNSGHLTIEAHVTSQFEQHVRAVCGLPLGSTEQLRAAAMVNLLGDCWAEGKPNWSAALERGDTKLHLYGKSEPKLKRKMGHLTSLANSVDDARRTATDARSSLAASPTT